MIKEQGEKVIQDIIKYTNLYIKQIKPNNNYVLMKNTSTELLDKLQNTKGIKIISLPNGTYQIQAPSWKDIIQLGQVQEKSYQQVLDSIIYNPHQKFQRSCTYDPQPTVLKHISHTDFSQLKQLILSKNFIKNIEPLSWISIQNVLKINLEDNFIHSLKSLAKTRFSKLKRLSLCNNLYNNDNVHHLTRIKINNMKFNKLNLSIYYQHHWLMAINNQLDDLKNTGINQIQEAYRNVLKQIADVSELAKLQQSHYSFQERIIQSKFINAKFIKSMKGKFGQSTYKLLQTLEYQIFVLNLDNN